MKSCLKTHSRLEQNLSLLYYQHGLLVSHYSKTLLFLLCVTIPIFTSPILKWSLFDKLTLSPRYWSSNAEYIGLTPTTDTDPSPITSSYFQCILHPDLCNEMPPSWFYGSPAMSVQQIVVSFSPYRQPIGNVLRNTQKITEQLLGVIDASLEELHGGNTAQDICFRVVSSFLDDATYSTPKCLVLSPLPIILNIFHEKPSKSLEPFIPQSLSIDTQLRNPFSSVKELLFGGFWTHWSSLLGLGTVDTSDQLTFSLTLFLNTSSQQIQTKQTEFMDILHRNLGSNAKQTEWLHIFYPQDEELFELFPLIFLYSVVFLYISISVSKIEEVKSRVGLACTAVSTLFGSVCISVGVCILFGLRATLDGRNVVPCIIVVIGLENILLITKSVISTPRELDTPLRIAKGLGQQGVAITRSMVTQISLLMVAYLTFNPSIQEFCLISILGLVNNYFLTMAFFLPILSIDLKRLELSEMKQTPDIIENTSAIGNKKQANSSLKPLYLRIIHKLEEMRILQKLFTILLCIFLAWWLITSRNFQTLTQELGIDNAENLKKSLYSIIGSDSSEQSQYAIRVNTQQSNPYFQELHENIISDKQYVYDRDSSFVLQPSNDSDIALCGANPCWTELIKYHLPNLFSYYNMSLTGEYITLLPPIYLKAIGNLEVPPHEGQFGSVRYMQPPEFGLDFLLMIIGSLLTISFIMVTCNQLVFRLTLRKGMPSNSDLHNANITCQILGTLYDGSQVVQPLEYVLCNSGNIIATRLRDAKLQLWNISAKPNNFSINQQKQINLVESIRVDSSDADQTESISENDSTDSSGRGEEANTVRGYEFPKHFSFFAPHLDILAATLPDRPKRIPLFDPNAPILWCIQCSESWLAAGFHNGLVVLWDISSNQRILQLQPTTAGITCIQLVLRPHNLVMCGTVDGCIIKIPIANAELMQKIKISDKMMTHLDYAHNRVVVSSFECCALRVYSVDRMAELFTLLRHPGHITCTYLDKAFLLGCTTGCKNGMVCCWDLETGTCVRYFRETKHKIISVLTTKTLIITLALDRIVRMRERVSGELVKKVEPETMPRSMCLLTENQLVVGCKGSAVLYNLAYDMLEPKAIQLREGKEMDHVSKILKVTPSVFACTTRKYIYLLSWGISNKEKSE